VRRLVTGFGHGSSVHPRLSHRAGQCFDSGTSTIPSTEVTAIVEPAKLTEKAANLAGKAVEAAGPLKDKAAGAAGQAAAVAGPLAAQAKDRATQAVGQAAAAASPLKEKAEDLLEKAGEIAAQGVSTVAEGIDKVTGGKFSGRISSVSAKIEKKLDPEDE
jgi:hypothetical protein